MDDCSDATSGAVLRGWQLWVAWTGIAALVGFGVVFNARGILPSAALLTKAIPAYEALHLDFRFDSGERITPRTGGVAETAGLPEGRLISIDGRPVSPDVTFLEVGRRLSGPAGEPIRLAVEAEEGDRVTADGDPHRGARP